MREGVEVAVQDLSAGYGFGPFRRPALNGLSLIARPRRTTAIIGPNGAGKTTLFRVLLGFHAPRGGTVRIGSLEPAVYRRRHGVAFLPESTPRPGGWSACSLLEEGCDLHGLHGRERRRALETALSRCGLEPRDHRTSLARLSRGMARRVVLAYALLAEPSLVLLDEPLSGLDPESRARARTVLGEIAAGGATVVLTSHQLGEVARMADEAVVLRDGRIVRTLTDPAGAPVLEEALAVPVVRQGEP